VRGNGFIRSVLRRKTFQISGIVMTVVRFVTRSIEEMVVTVICDVCVELLCDES
jgi:hypothetical protein